MRLKRKCAILLEAVMVCGLLITGCSRQEETKAYTFHDVYIGAEEFVENQKNSSHCEDVSLNADGSVTLILTEAQRKQWADPRKTEAMLLPLKMMGVAVTYAEDYTRMTISAPDGVAEAAAPMICNFAWAAELYQVLNGTEKWSLEVIVVSSDTGETIQQLHLPEDGLDWSFVGQ